MRLSFINTLYRHFSTNSNLPSLTKIPYKHRAEAVKQAQQVLTDYLHSTRALPFTFAENISKNSTFSLSELIQKVPFSPAKFRNSFQKFLRYNPINEFGFFYESIGIDYVLVGGFLKPNVHFFSDDCVVLDAACCLAGFGFPWDRLGRLYVEEVSIFGKESEFLCGRLNWLVEVGFSNEEVVGICLAFPGLLSVDEGRLRGEFGGVLDDLKRVFVDLGLGGFVEGNVDVWCEACGKMKIFYGLGLAKGEVGELMIKGKSVLIEYSERDLVEKVEFFCRLGVDKAEVGLFILCNPDVLRVEIENRVISVLGFLEHFGLRKKKLDFVQKNYGYVLGRNKMANLPHILRAMDLHEWFFHRVKCGNYDSLAGYDLSSPEEDLDEAYVQNLENITSVRTFSYSFSKLDFLHRIGFGENNFTTKLLFDVHGSASDLQERFDFLLHEGIEYSKLCKMISNTPKLLNQEVDNLRKKVDFLIEEIGLSLEDLVIFPSYLLYNLEKRVKPRYRFHVWLTEQGLCTKKYTLASIIAVSHKGFLSQLSRIHPTAPQLWLERQGKKNQIYNTRNGDYPS